MIVVAVIGIAFGVLGIFTFGLIFVPLAALCAVVALIGAVVQGRFATGFLAVVAGVLAGVGFAVSPTLWLATAAAVGH